jgi:hypothetical protein
MTRTWKGRLRHGALGLGGWTLEADDGRSYILVGSVPSSLDGERVEVRGSRLAVVIRVEEIRPQRSTLGDP